MCAFAPIFLDLDPKIEIHLRAKEFFEVLAGAATNQLESATALAYENTLVRCLLTENFGANGQKASLIAEFLNNDCRSVRDLFVSGAEDLLTNNLGSDLSLGLIGDHIIREKPIGFGKELFALAEKHDFVAFVPIAAKKGKNVPELMDECSKFLSESDWFFPEDMITDQPERQIAAEIIREKILRTLNKEIPHGTAVVIEEFKDEGTLIRIRAEIFCEKASHKGIIVGKGGEALKLIGTYAREDLEKMFGTKIYLNLWVKVKENWRESARTVGNFGYRDEE